MSQAIQARVIHTTLGPLHVGISTPVQNCCSSFTRGNNYELIVAFGSLGPGIKPIKIILVHLYLSERGRFWITK